MNRRGKASWNSDVRDEVRRNHERFFEVYVRCTIDKLVERDVKGLYKKALAGEIGVGSGGRALHPATCAARELPCRGRGAAHDGGDLVERQAEHVVQHERDALGGGQRSQHHEQRESDRVGQQHLLLGVERVRQVDAQRLLAPRLSRPQHVEAHPRDDRRHPPTQVFDSGRSRPAQAQPRFLHGVFGFADRTEHPVGHRPQVGTLGLEPLRQPVMFFHRSHSLVVVRHSSDVGNPADVTRRSR